MLELVEEALDEVTLAIEGEIATAGRLAVGFGWDHRRDASLGQHVDEGVRVEGLIAEQGLWIDGFQQRFGAGQIVGLPGRKLDLDGIAERIDQGVDFGGQSTARAPDRLLAVFFRAPALC